ncbi:unannotated protein [freshwater metagenome]|uniref:Unannotated protein n=1 Tax=freshwater metagenome TaxID=449393 RepID=A0A6J6QXS6_9ZZZZ
MIPSNRITTSCPCSTRRLAHSIANSATCVCSSAGRSNVEAITSPSIDRRMSVTSSGRSSSRRTMSSTSGWFCSIACATVCKTVVFPALGGATMSPRCPLPIGEIRSIIREVMSYGWSSRSNRSCSEGNTGVSSSKLTRSRANSGSTPLTASMRRSAGFFSPRLAGRLAPVSQSPRRRPSWRVCLTDT